MRIREIAQARVRYGYRKIRVLLNREGWKVGKYLVERIYREEGLALHSGGKDASSGGASSGISSYRAKSSLGHRLCGDQRVNCIFPTGKPTYK